MTTPASDYTPAAAPEVLTPEPAPVEPTPAEVVLTPAPEPETEVIEPETGSAVAVPDSADVEVAETKWEHTSDWKYDWLPFKGDNLAIRIPKGAALQALGNSRHCSDEFQERLVHMFVAKHISDETYERITYRMVDPDDEDIDMKSWGELLNAIAELGSERAKGEMEALAAVTSSNDKKDRTR